jgi:hypothetical protein
VLADRNFPPFPRAMRDGYAVRAADLSQLPAMLTVIGEMKAGADNKDIPVLQPGQAVTIMTGAPAPPGSDAVVMVEHTTRQANSVQITKRVAAGDNIVPLGSEARRGERLLSPGSRLDYAAIAVAASTGRSRLLVYRKPQVAILATGDESWTLTSLLEPIGSGIPIVIRWPHRCGPWRRASPVALLPMSPHAFANSLPTDSSRLASARRRSLDEQVRSGGAGLAEFRPNFLHRRADSARKAGGLRPHPVAAGDSPANCRHLHQSMCISLASQEILSTMVTFELSHAQCSSPAGVTPHKLMFLSARLKSR